MDPFTPAPKVDTTERDVDRRDKYLQRRIRQTENAQDRQNTERAHTTATEQSKQSLDQLKASVDALKEAGGGVIDLDDINTKLDQIIAAQAASDAAFGQGWAGMMGAIMPLDAKIVALDANIKGIQQAIDQILIAIEAGIGLG